MNNSLKKKEKKETPQHSLVLPAVVFMSNGASGVIISVWIIRGPGLGAFKCDAEVKAVMQQVRDQR